MTDGGTEVVDHSTFQIYSVDNRFCDSPFITRGNVFVVFFCAVVLDLRHADDYGRKA